MLDFVELIAAETGLPGRHQVRRRRLEFWDELAALDGQRPARRRLHHDRRRRRRHRRRAAGVHRSRRRCRSRSASPASTRSSPSEALHEQIVFIGSGKLGFPEGALLAFALGCDLVNVGREAMLAIGCIQAQRCHTGECPTGVATQNRGSCAASTPRQGRRLANYLSTLRRDLLKVSEACGVSHPSLIGVDDLDILNGQESATPLRTIYGYQYLWGQPSASDEQDIDALMAQANRNSADSPST